MRVILREAAHAHDAVQRAGRFIARAGSEFGHADRQVAIGFQAHVEDLHMAGAVHGFQRVDDLFARAFLVHFHDEHVLAVVFPVTRGLPQLAVHDLRRVHLHIAVAALLAAHVILQRGVDGPAIRVPEDLPRRFFLHVEEVHLAAQLAVVALCRFLQHRHMGLQIVAVLEGHAIDALQHRARAVAQPIGPRHMRQLERIRRNLPRMLEMRATAEVLPVAMPIHPQVLILGDLVDQFHLVGLAPAFVIGQRIGAAPDFGPHGIAGVDDLLHLGLDLAKVIGREGFRPVEIVEPAVIADGADGHLHIGPDLLHRAGHDMGKVMPDQFQRGHVILHRVDGDARVGVDRPLQIPVLAIDHGRNGRLGKRGRNGLCHLRRRHAGIKVADIAIGECQGNLGHVSAPSSVWRPRNARLRVMCRFPARGRGECQRLPRGCGIRARASLCLLQRRRPG